MKHIQKTIRDHPLAKHIPHPWAFQRSEEFTNEFAWPKFDFDLNEALEEERANDKTLEHMSARLARHMPEYK